jgi:cytochrome c oxidase subunit II
LSISTARFSIGHKLHAASLALAVASLSGCAGHLSTLTPAGTGAEQTLKLFWVMIAVAFLVWSFVIAAAIYAARRPPQPDSVRSGHRLIVFGGILLPLVLIGPLLYFGFKQTNELLAPGHGLVIHVTGERWWWRVRYESASGVEVVTANEIRIPQGQRVEFRLDSSDVIHSFWIPSLGGKIDMIPGRVNRLVLEASREGRFRGACAEFCGLSHTLMEFDVLVMAGPAFDEWLANAARDAGVPSSALAARGRDLFLRNGCGACHNITGTPANGLIGPDLTHVGSRLSIAAGTLPMEAGPIASWVAHAEAIKPGALMPRYSMLAADELAAIGTYLEGLE